MRTYVEVNKNSLKEEKTTLIRKNLYFLNNYIKQKLRTK